MDPSVDLMIGVWGVLFAGAGYLPLSPEYPAERLRYMIADSGTKVVLADQALRAQLTELAPAGRSSSIWPTRVVTAARIFDRSGGPGQPGLHDLHLRQHGQPERCYDRAPQRCQPDAWLASGTV